MNHELKISIQPESESSVRMSFGESIDENILRRIMMVNDALHHNPFPGFIESVPAYTTLTVFYDPLLVLEMPDTTKNFAFERVTDYLKKFTVLGRPSRAVTGNQLLKIPVCYDGKFGPDIGEVAEHNKLEIDEVIRIHTEKVYTVYLVGFLPGFPYLGALNKKIATPRRLAPRKLVPEGSVGIAGDQTGIYPLNSPGGWQIIGRTPMRLFDPNSEEPALLRAGNHVQFSSITSTEFYELSADI